MGQRYAAILNYMNIPWVGVDRGDVLKWKDVNRILIATPTENHYQYLKYYRAHQIPILCEKPISKDENELLSILSFDQKLYMVNQYRYLVKSGSTGATYYDYFKSGTDGLAWDCINILGLAQGDVSLANESPYWKCKINGESLRISTMDKAYINMVKDFVYSGAIQQQPDYIEKAHERARGWRAS